MESSPYELQIFLSLVVIAAAACVALICDFLKGNNERLRELVIELQARHEEAPTGAAPETRIEMARPLERREAAPGFAQCEPSAEHSADQPRREARPRPTAPAATPKPTPRIVPQAARKTDWESLLARASAKGSASRLTQVTTKTSASAPGGDRDQFTLEQFTRKHRTVSGLVVSIGVSGANPLPDAVVRFIPTLLEANEFGCRHGDGEFVLICPSERGAAAQRRLSRIAQQLWDFQLRSLGSLEVVFNWGGVEVNGEAPEEAIALATERMMETGRGREMRNLVPMEPRRLRTAV